MLGSLLQTLNNGKEITTESTKVTIAIFILMCWAVKNALRLDKQGSFNNFSAIYQFSSTILVIVLLIGASIPDKISSHEFVWTTFHNETGFDDNKKANVLFICLIGVLMSSYGMSGYESGATLAEETKNASREAPRGIIKALLLSSLIGFIFIVGLLYAS